MKKASYIFLLIASLLILMNGRAKALTLSEHNDSVTSIAVDSKPKGYLEFDSLYVDLGILKKDTLASGVLGFRNTGDAPLSILNIYTQCGCTKPSYSHDPVMPGERGEIRINFSTKGREAGTFRKALRVRSDASNERITLHVKGRVG